MRGMNVRSEMVGFVACALITAWSASAPTPLSAEPSKVFAQELVEQTLAKHPELSGLEVASTPPHKQHCETIAASEAKEIGEKCDQDEFTAIKTNKPFVEKEMEEGKEVYDITMPLHDGAGKVIATAGMDFKPKPDQQESKLVENAQNIAKEIEAEISTKGKLFEPAK